MGYDLHITRRKNWADLDRPIDAETWLDYIRTDTSLQLQPDNGCYFVCWISSSSSEKYDLEWLDWHQGQIYSKNPSVLLRKKMFTIAKELGATLQGDDGEEYDINGEEVPYIEATGNVYISIIAFWHRMKKRLDRMTLNNPLGAPYCIEPLWFSEGDTILDCFNNEQKVIKIDRKALHGEGLIMLKDKQGHESTVYLQSYRTFKPID